MDNIRALRNQEQIGRHFNVVSHHFPPPTEVKNYYEYLDYALCVLGQTVETPFEVFPNLLVSSPSGFVKCTRTAEVARNKGNDLFTRGELFEASASYTCSIAYAEPGSNELALSYGNRSAVLFRQKLFRECLKDIELALENNYPEDKKEKLIHRKDKATMLLRTQKKTPYHGPLPKIKKTNPDMPGASNCIKVENNAEYGRHIVASKEISPGQLLLVEKPYTQSLEHNIFTDKFFLCSECLEWCYNLIPCDKCSGALYCSDTCRSKAFVDYHRYECVILKYFGNNTTGSTCIRMTLKGTKEFKTTDPNNGIYRNMSRALSKRRFPTFDTAAFIEVAEAAKIFYVLKHYTDFFLEFDIEDSENVLKKMLLNDVHVHACNFTIVTRWSSEHQFPVGKAIYQTVSMFNHACSENAMIFFYGSTAVVKARKTIKQGEQCFINYGPNPAAGNTLERQRVLKAAFNVDACKCKACCENWPREEHMNNAMVKRSVAMLIEIHREVCSRMKIDQYRKDLLLKRTFSIAEELEDKVPCTIHKITQQIFGKLLSDGNRNDDFSPIRDLIEMVALMTLNSLIP